jgi:hypothetical protein
MLAQAVQTRTVRKTCAKSHVLILKDDLCCGSVEKDLATLASNHRKAERIFLVLELEVRTIAAASAGFWALKYRFGDLVNFVGRILYLDVQTLVFVMCQSR